MSRKGSDRGFIYESYGPVSPNGPHPGTVENPLGLKETNDMR